MHIYMNLQCTDDNWSYQNVCNMPFVLFSLAVIFIIHLYKNLKFKIIKIRTGYQYAWYFNYSEQLNRAEQNLQLDCMWPAGRRLDIGGLACTFIYMTEDPKKQQWLHQHLLVAVFKGNAASASMLICMAYWLDRVTPIPWGVARLLTSIAVCHLPFAV